MVKGAVDNGLEILARLIVITLLEGMTVGLEGKEVSVITLRFDDLVKEDKVVDEN